MTAPGDTLGPYVIEAQLASGGMGVVYRARNRVTGQLRALKVVRPELARNIDFVDRFVREATIASQLRHPNLVETLEPGIDGDTIYLPMELLDGETLATRLRRVQRLSPTEAAAILVPIAEAVQLLHDRGIVHRDLKPANVFLARAGDHETPKVIDLGTARDVDDDEHTRTGVVIGSPFYMAIEQAEGRRDIDGRADQYALGVIAYQMLTGVRPYESDDSQSALAKLLRGEPYPPPSAVAPGGVMPGLERVIARALERDREQRFPSTLELARALHRAVSDEETSGMRGSHAPTSASSGATAERSAPRALSRRALVWAAIVAVLAVGVISAAVGMGAPRAITATPLPDAAAHRATPAAVITVERVASPLRVDDAAATAPVASSGAAHAPEATEPEVEDPEQRAVRRRSRARRERARAEDLACGATTGIPCL